MRFKAIKLFVLLLSCDLISCDGYFTIIGSKLIRHSAKYHVSVTSQGYDAPPILEVAIRSSNKEGKVFEVVNNVTLINGKSQNIEFDLKNQPMEDCNLEVESLTGDSKYQNYVKLDMNTKKNTIFVQTDKAMYKPSDNVQFRVIALDADMRPHKGDKVQVFISDGAQNRVKQFANVQLTKGVFQSELKLSDSPVLGNWLIHVKLNNDNEITKEFEVAEYTLPKFEVKIDVNPDANFKEGKIRATIRAKYTFGKIAKGNATITAEVLNNWGWGKSKNEVKVVKSIQVDGKKPVEFDIEDELKITDKNREKTVKLFATFKEELTEREQNATATVQIHVTPHKIALKKSSEKFKPGLPFSITASVNLHDKNTPVSDEKTPIKVTIKYFYDSLRTCERKKYYYEEVTESPDTTVETYECRDEHSYEVGKEVFLKNGIVHIDIDIPLNTTRFDFTAKYLDTVQSLNYITRDQSENNQYIQIKSATANPKLSENVRIDVMATENLQKLTYQVLGRGDVLASEDVDVPNKKSFQLTFKPTLAMVPKANVIVYYITSDGEIISDLLTIEFGNELGNHIRIDLSKDQAKPKETLDVTVSSNPNSFVGLLGVDQSVLLLKSGNDIEQSTVFAEMETYNKINKYNYEFYSEYDYRIYTDFRSSGSVVLTNAKKQYVPKYVPMPPSSDNIKFSPRGGSASGSSGVPFAGVVPLSAMIERGPQMRPPQQDRVTFGDAMDSSVEGHFVPAEPQKPIEIRTDFPETWIFDSFDFDDKTSNVTISKKVPDTITSWIITGFSVDPITGLGLTRRPSKLNVFQPFFVSTNLPYSIKRGEVVSIPVLLFNYLDADQTVEVTLFNSEGEFEFAEVNEEENHVRRRKRSMDTQRKKNIFIESQSGVSMSFMIRPLKVGHITIKVVASSAVAGDGVERQLIVEPEGVTQYMNKAVFIDLRNNPEFKSNISITIPRNAVPDSTKIEASAIGDILGPTIENLDKLIKLPCGCGEQNMLNFVPNIVVLDYLTTLNKLTPEIESKSKKYMETGYQRELSYKHDDGSYSAFGKNDDSGSTWLTAFVAKSFHQASKYIMVDPEIIKQALDFLVKVQNQNGSFPEVGHVSHKDMQGGASDGIALTAYTLITFLENQELIPQYKNTIDKALDYVVQNKNSLDDNYSLAIASYAMQLAKHTSKESLLSILGTKSENKNDMRHWFKAVPKSEENNPWNDQPNSVNVEMSAYALQAFVEAARVSDAVPIMKWLITQRNENGGFQSTQDTVVGLQALSKLASKIYVKDSKVDITVAHDLAAPTIIQINEDNALLLQKHELPSDARNFVITARGRGFSILQLSYRYNLNNSGEWPRFILEPQLDENSNKDFLHLKVCTSFVPDDAADKSNMAVMEVTLPSGFTFDSDSLPELKATKNVKKIETKDGETLIVLYFDDLSSEKICPEIKAYRTHSVALQKPAPIVIYDYYDNSRVARSFYNAPEVSLCDICNGEEECKKDCEEPEVNIV